MKEIGQVVGLLLRCAPLRYMRTGMRRRIVARIREGLVSMMELALLCSQLLKILCLRSYPTVLMRHAPGGFNRWRTFGQPSPARVGNKQTPSSGEKKTYQSSVVTLFRSFLAFVVTWHA